MRKSLRILGWTAASLLAIPVFIYLGLVLINLKDDPLSPEVEKLLNAQPPAIEASTNAYFAWIGISGPEDQEPHAWGQRWYNEVLNNDKQARVSFPPPELTSEKERCKESIEIPCEKLETCLEVVATNPKAALDSLQKGKTTLERGDKTLTYPAYQEAWRPDYSASSAIPPFAGPWSKLSATRFALSVAEGRHEEALDQLNREISFLTRQIKGSSSLIDKMIGFGYLRHRYLLLNQYLQRHPAEAIKHSERITGMLTVLPDDAVSLQPCLQSEKRINAVLLLSLKNIKSDVSRFTQNDEDRSSINHYWSSLSDLLMQPLFLENNTVNGVAARYDELIRIDSLKGDAYRHALVEVRDRKPEIYTFRNPIGNALKNMSGFAYRDYFLRRDDLRALRGLVDFQFKLLRQGTSDSETITAKLKAEQESLRHPYSGEMPAWNKEKRRLSYPLLNPEGINKLLAIQI